MGLLCERSRQVARLPSFVGSARDSVFHYSSHSRFKYSKSWPGNEGRFVSRRLLNLLRTIAAFDSSSLQTRHSGVEQLAG